MKNSQDKYNEDDNKNGKKEKLNFWKICNFSYLQTEDFN